MARQIDYGNLMHTAMRGLIRAVLRDVAEKGLPGKHHFFITFDTQHPDAELADWLAERYPGEMTIVGIIGLAALVNLVVGSASAKWALLSPIFVPMLMQLGISPELTQAAYRVGDSTTNIITPLMPYFPLVVVFCQRYVKRAGIGTVVSLMLPYSVVLLVTWSIFLVANWLLGVPLGLQGGYVYP